MYSMTNACRPASLALSYFHSLRDPASETELYNSKLGMPHAVKGSQLQESDILQCLGSYGNGSVMPKSLVTMGVDVGKYLHYEVCEWFLGKRIGDDVSSDATCRVIQIGKTEQWDELDRLMRFWRVHTCVIDRNPEPRNALQFANKFYGHVRLCMYGNGINGKNINISKTEEHLVLVDRTAWLN